MNKQDITGEQRIDNPFIKPKEGIRKRLLTVKEASVYLGMSLPTLRNLYWNGAIPIIRTGEGEKDKIRIDINDLDKWIEQYKTTYTY